MSDISNIQAAIDAFSKLEPSDAEYLRDHLINAVVTSSPPRNIVCNLAYTLLRDRKHNQDILPQVIRRLLEECPWMDQKDKHGKNFASFEEYLNTRLWHGLETPTDVLRDYLKGSPDVLALLEAELEYGTGGGVA